MKVDDHQHTHEQTRLHLQAMAAKSALVAQCQQELEQGQACHAQSNKAHEAHITKLIASLDDMQQLCNNQVGG